MKKLELRNSKRDTCFDLIEWVYIAQNGMPDPDRTVLIAFENSGTDELELGSLNFERYTWVDSDGYAFDLKKTGPAYAWAYAPAKPPRGDGR